MKRKREAPEEEEEPEIVLITPDTKQPAPKKQRVSAKQESSSSTSSKEEYKKYEVQQYQQYVTNFEQLFESEKDCDVIFHVSADDDEDSFRELKAHKIILCTQSKYFRTMFYSEWEESTQTPPIIIKKPDVQFSVFKEVLRFIYSGKALLSPTNVIQCVQVALEMMLDDLIGLCVQCVKSIISMDNVFHLFNQFVSFNTKSNSGSFGVSSEGLITLDQNDKLIHLKNICLQYIAENAARFFELYIAEMTEDDLISILEYPVLEMSEEDVFRHVHQWAQIQYDKEQAEAQETSGASTSKAPTPKEEKKKRLAEIAKNIVSLIRLPCMSLDFVQSVVEQSGIVSQDVLFQTYKFFATKNIETTSFATIFATPRSARTLKQLTKNSWSFEIPLAELDKTERGVDSPTFSYMGVKWFIRLYWRMKPNLTEPHLAMFVVLDTTNLPENFTSISVGKTFKIVNQADPKKSLVKKINKSEFNKNLTSGGRKELIAKSNLSSKSSGYLNDSNAFLVTVELTE